MHVGILARRIHVEGVMRVLHGGNGDAAADQRRDQLGQQGGLAGAAPAGQTDDAHWSVLG